MSEELDVFLSYDREDKPLADRIFLRLRRHGIRVWMDKPPQPYAAEGIVPGTSWNDVLHAQIRNARSFLPLFTETAVETGSYFEHELITALQISSETPDRSNFIVPVLSGGKPPDLRVAGGAFDAFQWVDIEADGLNALVRHLLKSLPARSGLDSAADTLKLEISTVDQLVDAVGPNRVIRLAPGDYNLSKVRAGSHEFMSIEPEFDGPQLVFHSLKNVELFCDGPEPAHLYVEPRYAFALYLSRCEGVRLRNLRFGHSPDPGECIGGVVRIGQSKNIDLNECDLYGCGTVGLLLEHVESVVVSNSLIRDCNHAFVDIAASRDVMLHHCTFRNNAVYYGFQMTSSDNIRIADTMIRDNEKNEFFAAETPMVLSRQCTGVALEGCQITQYPFVGIADPAQGVEILSCDVY